MDMEKRTLLAFAISMVIISVWFLVMEPRRAEMQKQAPPQKPKTAAATVAKAPPTAPQALSEAAVNEEIIVTETPLYRAAWSTKGGRLVSLKLKRYKESLSAKSGMVEMIKTPMPGLTITGGMSDENLIYTASTHGTVAVDRTPYQLTFTAQMAQGIIVKKIFTIDPAGYLIGYRNTLENQAAAPLALGTNLTLADHFPVEGEGSQYTFEGPALLNGKHLEEFKLSKIKKPGAYREFSGQIKWFGFEDKYFLKAVIIKDVSQTTVTIRRTDEKSVKQTCALPGVNIKPGYAQTQEMALFIGPKVLGTLKASGYELNKALDFGFFDIIAKPLLISLNWIEKYVGSYGLAIIILTFFIKILLYPLTLKSFKSMKELQKVQPLMKEIQQKYKDDKQKLNQALMKLYQEHKINPMGGCLPMLLQIPILFALYKVFLASIELRHTPFHIWGTWLPDLSAKDPYYITPILMGLSWFVQQKMTPAPGDPMQQKIMMFMPIVFTVMFLNFPSGLVIYWLVSNILSILQQAYINRVHA